MVAISRVRSSRELHEEVVRAIEREIALGRSRRAIAIATGIDRKTIDKIAAGVHTNQVLGRRYQRCPNGHLAILPCRTCAIREEISKPAA